MLNHLPVSYTVTGDQPNFDELLDLLSPPSWHRDAACKEAPESVTWFPKGTGAAAKAICGACLCREACLAWALDQGPDLEGIWAGTTAKERRAIRAGQRAA